MYDGFRSSSEHVQDIDKVIQYLKKQADIPIWLIGMSRGTESDAHLAINTTQQLNGLVLTLSMSKPNDKGVSVPEMELIKIMISALIVAHRNDGCYVTLPESAKEIAKLLTHVKRLK